MCSRAAPLVPLSFTLQTCFHSVFLASQQVLNTAACTLELSTVLKKHGALQYNN